MTEAQTELQKLDKLVKQSHRVLYTAQTIFPFHLFPSKIVIDENQVSVTRNAAFRTGDVQSILISEIKSVSISTTILFGSLTVDTMLPTSTPIAIDYLWKDDAVKARRLIQGMMTVVKENIDLSQISEHDLHHRIFQIGHEMD